MSTYPELLIPDRMTVQAIEDALNGVNDGPEIVAQASAQHISWLEDVFGNVTTAWAALGRFAEIAEAAQADFAQRHGFPDGIAALDPEKRAKIVPQMPGLTEEWNRHIKDLAAQFRAGDIT
ncbi:MAG: hypothetical protein AAGB15_07210 [Pseudomonadota bacterium]